jgi:hypothetical protein
MAALLKLHRTVTRFTRDSGGDAVVEAAILFPLMIMIFAALVLLAIYLPARATLQRATQYAATAISTEKSDSWLFFDDDSMSYYFETDKTRLENVYAALFSGVRNAASRGEDIVIDAEGRSLSVKAGELTVDCYVVDWFVYKEVIVTASRIYTMPVNLSFIGFPDTLPITVTSTAVVQNGEEFVRNMDMAVDFIKYLRDKFGLNDIADSIGSSLRSVSNFMGW